jgi:hypothetical protein
MKVTSLSSSKSFLLPTRMMTMPALANVLASSSQVLKWLYDSRLSDMNKSNKMSTVNIVAPYTSAEVNKKRGGKPRDVVDEKSTSCAAVVAPCD